MNQETIEIKNPEHLLGQTESVLIEFTKADVRHNYYPEGLFMQKTKATKLIKQGLAKLKVIQKLEKQDEPIKVKWINKAMRGKYENNICHMSRSKAERLQDQGYLKIIEDLQS